MNQESNKVIMEIRGDREIIFTRYFAAPRQLVYDCHTRPELMRRWLIGPEGMQLHSCEMDLRPGGKYLYLYADGKGSKSGVYGTFKEVVAPEMLSNTENYIMDYTKFDPNIPEDPNATFESRTFTSEGPGTLMTHTCRYASAEICRFVNESGAIEGMAACYAVLDKVLREFKKQS